MITRIEIDGFKTFQNFAVDLAPFQVIIGANGCGKSNFFDALDLLSKLATSDARTAFKSIRGDINELFTILPDNQSTKRMRFVVEMIVNTPVSDELNQESNLQFFQMRYEIEVRQHTTQDGLEQLYIHEERLLGKSISIKDWQLRHTFNFQDETRFEENSISEWLRIQNVPFKFIRNAKLNNIKWLVDANVSLNVEGFIAKSLLNSHGDLTPASKAVQQELQSLRLLRLDTQVLRKQSSFVDEPFMSNEGGNLPAVLARMQMQDKLSLKDVSRDVFNIVPNFENIEVDRDEGRKLISLYANMRDKRRFSINALSEGTLRILALATLRNDPQLQGTLCFEDPEMGVHPGALKRIVKLLREMSTDLNDPEDLEFPLRQVLVTTHSPELVSHLKVAAGELLFAVMPTRLVPGEADRQVTLIMPVGQDVEGDKAAKSYTLNQVFKYLNNADYQAMRDNLRKAAFNG